MPRDLLIALRFMTRLPVPRAEEETDDLARSAIFFPAVGLIIGVLLALAMRCLKASGPWIASLAGLLLWVWVTGALHLDGLGDVADAFGASHGAPERFLHVLDDPHAGSFAIVAIALQVTAKLVLLAHVPQSFQPWALVLIPAWARWGTLVWSASLPPLKPGLGERVAQAVSWRGIAAWGVLLAGASAYLAAPALAVLLVVPAIGLSWRWRLGGITGDCLGASIEVTESALLLAFAVRGA